MEKGSILAQVKELIDETVGRTIPLDGDLIVGTENITFIQMLKIILKLETHFQITFSEEELSCGDVYTITKLATLVEQKLGG